MNLGSGSWTGSLTHVNIKFEARGKQPDLRGRSLTENALSVYHFSEIHVIYGSINVMPDGVNHGIQNDTKTKLSTGH